MHALASQGIEVGWQDSHKGLALACPHLCNLALVQDHASNQLDVKGTQAQHTAGCFPHHLQASSQRVGCFKLPTAPGRKSAGRGGCMTYVLSQGGEDG